MLCSPSYNTDPKAHNGYLNNLMDAYFSSVHKSCRFYNNIFGIAILSHKNITMNAMSA
jgi:hypothetical protein